MIEYEIKSKKFKKQKSINIEDDKNNLIESLRQNKRIPNSLTK